MICNTVRVLINLSGPKVPRKCFKAYEEFLKSVIYTPHNVTQFFHDFSKFWDLLGKSGKI